MPCEECIIGLLYYTDDSRLVTVEGLLNYIEDEKYFNEIARHEGLNSLIRKVHSIRDYADRRKSTNLTRFTFCPHCGKEIDWKKIKETKKAGE